MATSKSNYLKRSPNQYKIKIEKEKVVQTNDKRTYFLSYNDTMRQAARELSGNEFKLYIYFLSNKDGYESFFSPKDVKQQFGMCEDTARSCFHKLIEKGYIESLEQHNCMFHDKPQKKINLTIKKERRLIIDDDGVAFEMTFEEFKAIAPKELNDDEILNYWNECDII
jgi:hypothetical protein